jgi:hypothetical protein
MVILRNFWMFVLNVLIWIDIGLNVLFFSGNPYETMSSRAQLAAITALAAL